jgi:ATP-binding cassette subfamily C protein
MIKYLAKYKGLVFINILFLILFSFVIIFQASLLKDILDCALNHNYDLKYLLTKFFIFLLSLFFVHFLRDISNATLNRNVTKDLRRDIFSANLKYKSKKFQ